jgi:penicillin-binding protein 1A
VEVVKRELPTLPELGATRAERAEAVLTGGLRIEVTIDPALQEVAAAAVREALRDPAGPTGAVEQFDVASQARRQPGSAFKPFVAVAVLEAGLPVTTLLDGDGPMVLHGADGARTGRSATSIAAATGRWTCVRRLPTV